jgi:hypothetical protein
MLTLKDQGWFRAEIRTSASNTSLALLSEFVGDAGWNVLKNAE